MVKVERTFPAPTSLEIEAKKASGKYDKPDVIKQLRENYHDWNNLFWSCGHCNKVKNQEKYTGRIIDCCIEDPEELIFFRLKDGDVEVVAKDNDNERAILTSTLVYEVFNLKNTGMRIYKSDMRLQELNKEMNILYENLSALKRNPNSKVVMRKLKALLRRESKFAAFKRNYIRENTKEYGQLISYI